QLPNADDAQPERMPSLDAVPRPASASTAAAAEQLVLDRTSVQVLVLVDGQRTVREIIGERPIVPVLRSLARLAEHGLVSSAAPATTRTIRGPLLIAGGGVLGLIAIIAALMILPMLFQPQFVQAPPTPVVAFTAVPATAPPPRPTGEPLAAPTSVAKPTLAP